MFGLDLVLSASSSCVFSIPICSNFSVLSFFLFLGYAEPIHHSTERKEKERVEKKTTKINKKR